MISVPIFQQVLFTLLWIFYTFKKFHTIQFDFPLSHGPACVIVAKDVHIILNLNSKYFSSLTNQNEAEKYQIETKLYYII